MLFLFLVVILTDLGLGYLFMDDLSRAVSQFYPGGLDFPEYPSTPPGDPLGDPACTFLVPVEPDHEPHLTNYFPTFSDETWIESEYGQSSSMDPPSGNVAEPSTSRPPEPGEGEVLLRFKKVINFFRNAETERRVLDSMIQSFLHEHNLAKVSVPSLRIMMVWPKHYGIWYMGRDIPTQHILSTLIRLSSLVSQMEREDITCKR